MNNVPWVSKYRPKSVYDVACQHNVTLLLKKTITTKELPNLLLYGPPGTGKTSTILAIARDLFGPELMNQRILELNASDEISIQVIRDKIKTFSKISINGNIKLKYKNNYPCPKFKIIILDEADAMTYESQSGLRRIIEEHSDITRFCIICNYINRIIPQLFSRCVTFRFKPLTFESMENKLFEIAKAENLSIHKDIIRTLITTSNGDMRNAITTLQNAAHIYKNELKKKSSKKSILQLLNDIDDDIIADTINILKNKEFNNIEKAINILTANGYSAHQIIVKLGNYILHSDLSDLDKAKFSIFLSNVEYKLVKGGNEYLQLLTVGMELQNIL